MPLEIGEIGISLHVTSEDPRRHGEPSGADAEWEREQREDLIDECVRRVLFVLRAERER